MPDDFDSRALELYAAQRAAVPAYDAWCAFELGRRGEATGTVAEVRTWRYVPALPIAAYKTLDVFEAAAPVAAEWHSSGTTSTDRSTHRLGALDDYDAAIDEGVRAALVPDVAAGDREPLECVQLQPSAADAPHSSLTYMYDRIRTGPWCMDASAFVDADYRVQAEAAWEALRARAREEAPVLVLATSFALAMLLDAAEDGGWDALHLPHGSRVVDTGGYKGRTRELTRDELLARVEHWLGVPPAWCENEYGMSELSSQAWLGTVAAAAGHPLTLPAPGARWTPSTLRVRVVDPETLAEVADGDRGLLVFHDLANTWSCAAVRSEDLGIRRGDGFELVGRAPGATLKGCSLQLEEVAP
ncbi:MAG: long-chain fatty acid--CoA ligase [Thermoleophilia bacterium]|nr:long-chain fatty acid--CoA ligase [Thermoleophilia bacterium]